MADEIVARAKSYWREVRGNALWDLTKWAVVIGIPAAAVGIYAFVAWVLTIPFELRWALGLFAFTLVLACLAWVQQRPRRQGAGAVTKPAATSLRFGFRPEAFESPQRPEDRIFVEREPEDLIGMLRGHTSMQAARLVEPFIGKWMKFSRPVRDITAGGMGGGCFVHAEGNPAFIPRLHLNFSPRWVDRLSIAQKGDTITAIGQIAELNEAWITFAYCEVIDKNETQGGEPKARAGGRRAGRSRRPTF